MRDGTVRIAENASLTGSMGGGKEFAARSYNAILQHLTDRGEIPPALFIRLPENVSFDEVGVASAQLAEYLRDGLPEGEVGQGPAGRKLGDGNFIVSIGGLRAIRE